MFQATAWAWEVQPDGFGLKVAWSGEKVVKRQPTIKQTSPSKEGPRYLRIGGDPKDSNRVLAPNEKIQVSTKDFWVETNSGSGKIYKGWLPAGTEFVTAPTDNVFLRKAVWIKKCGNDVLNSENTAIFFRSPKGSPMSQQVQEAQASQEIVQLPPLLPAVTEPIAAAPKESWLSKNWPWVVGVLAVIGGIMVLSGGHGGGSPSPSSGPSPPPPGNN